MVLDKGECSCQGHNHFARRLPPQAEVAFKPNPEADTWYSLVVEDGEGLRAFSNPIWVDVTEFRPLPEKAEAEAE